MNYKSELEFDIQFYLTDRENWVSYDERNVPIVNPSAYINYLDLHKDYLDLAMDVANTGCVRVADLNKEYREALVDALMANKFEGGYYEGIELSGGKGAIRCDIEVGTCSCEDFNVNTVGLLNQNKPDRMLMKYIVDKYCNPLAFDEKPEYLYIEFDKPYTMEIIDMDLKDKHIYSGSIAINKVMYDFELDNDLNELTLLQDDIELNQLPVEIQPKIITNSDSLAVIDDFIRDGIEQGLVNTKSIER